MKRHLFLNKAPQIGLVWTCRGLAGDQSTWQLKRLDQIGLPGLSEPEIVRHYTSSEE
ncbi:MAG: hypothetical protein CM1200mP4_4290 [Rhodospirillaceae bacterium]|nr:MAG: hypothetical protein CM1200mP4_4290 [Rhodospirillaceae bacterium]